MVANQASILQVEVGKQISAFAIRTQKTILSNGKLRTVHRTRRGERRRTGDTRCRMNSLSLCRPIWLCGMHCTPNPNAFRLTGNWFACRDRIANGTIRSDCGSLRNAGPACSYVCHPSYDKYRIRAARLCMTPTDGTLRNASWRAVPPAESASARDRI